MKRAAIDTRWAAPATLLVGLALGWFGGASWQASRESDPLPSPSPSKPTRPGLPPTDPLAAGRARVWAAGDACAQAAAAVEWANSIDPEHFRAFLDTLHRLPSHAGRELAARTLLNRWMALDPGTALQWAAERDPDRIASLSGEWVRRDPSKIDVILAMLDRDKPRGGNIYRNPQTSALVGMFTTLARENREAARALLERPEVVRDVTRLVPQLRVFAREDPESVLRWAEKLGSTTRTSARKAVVRAMADTDAAEAVAWARQQPDQDDLLEAVLRDPKDPPSLVAALASLPVEEQSGLQENDFSIWGTGDPVAVVEALEKSRDALSPEALKGMLPGATESLLRATDPGALANRVLALCGESGWFSIASFASSYARQAPEAARGWAEALTDETQRQKALDAVENESLPLTERARLSIQERAIQSAAQGTVEDPQLMLTLDDTDRRRVLETALARELARPDAAADGSPESPNDPFGSSNSFSALGKLLYFYPADTARLLAPQLTTESTPALLNALSSSAAYWASEEPEAAAAWALSLPPGEARAWAASNVFHQWKQFDDKAARAWWAALPAEEQDMTRHGQGK